MLHAECDPAVRLPAAPQFPPDTKWGAVAREYLQEVKARLYQEHLAGASGQAIVNAYTGVIDRLICDLFNAASDAYAERFSRLGHRCSVIAQGGYGRAELNPGS